MYEYQGGGFFYDGADEYYDPEAAAAIDPEWYSWYQSTLSQAPVPASTTTTEPAPTTTTDPTTSWELRYDYTSEVPYPYWYNTETGATSMGDTTHNLVKVGDQYFDPTTGQVVQYQDGMVAQEFEPWFEQMYNRPYAGEDPASVISGFSTQQQQALAADGGDLGDWIGEAADTVMEPVMDVADSLGNIVDQFIPDTLEGAIGLFASLFSGPIITQLASSLGISTAQASALYGAASSAAQGGDPVAGAFLSYAGSVSIPQIASTTGLTTTQAGTLFNTAVTTLTGGDPTVGLIMGAAKSLPDMYAQFTGSTTTDAPATSEPAPAPAPEPAPAPVGDEAQWYDQPAYVEPYVEPTKYQVPAFDPTTTTTENAIPLLTNDTYQNVYPWGETGGTYLDTTAAPAPEPYVEPYVEPVPEPTPTVEVSAPPYEEPNVTPAPVPTVEVTPTPDESMWYPPEPVQEPTVAPTITSEFDQSTPPAPLDRVTVTPTPDESMWYPPEAPTEPYVAPTEPVVAPTLPPEQVLTVTPTPDESMWYPEEPAPEPYVAPPSDIPRVEVTGTQPAGDESLWYPPEESVPRLTITEPPPAEEIPRVTITGQQEEVPRVTIVGQQEEVPRVTITGEQPTATPVTEPAPTATEVPYYRPYVDTTAGSRLGAGLRGSGGDGGTGMSYMRESMPENESPGNFLGAAEDAAFNNFISEQGAARLNKAKQMAAQLRFGRQQSPFGFGV